MILQLRACVVVFPGKAVGLVAWALMALQVAEGVVAVVVAWVALGVADGLDAAQDVFMVVGALASPDVFDQAVTPDVVGGPGLVILGGFGFHDLGVREGAVDQVSGNLVALLRFLDFFDAVAVAVVLITDLDLGVGFAAAAFDFDQPVLIVPGVGSGLAGLVLACALGFLGQLSRSHN